MPRGQNLAEAATSASRAKGAKAANAARTRKKQEEELRAIEEFAERLGAAFSGLDRLLASDDPSAVARGVAIVFDRFLGKPRQTHEHAGRVELGVDIDAARAKLARALGSQR